MNLAILVLLNQHISQRQADKSNAKGMSYWSGFAAGAGDGRGFCLAKRAGSSPLNLTLGHGGFLEAWPTG
jgi:hypothetical protein